MTPIDKMTGQELFIAIIKEVLGWTPGEDGWHIDQDGKPKYWPELDPEMTMWLLGWIKNSVPQIDIAGNAGICCVTAWLDADLTKCCFEQSPSLPRTIAMVALRVAREKASAK